MKASVDKSVCIGCGLCPNLCNEVFQMDDDDGKAFVKIKDVPEESEEGAKEAEELCPVNAITVI